MTTGLETIASVTRHAPPRRTLLAVGPRSALAALRAAAALPPRDVYMLTSGEGETAAAALGFAFAFVGGRDVLLVQGGVRVAPGWLEGLAATARSDTAAASATPLSLGAGGVDVGWPDVGARTLEDLASTLRSSSLLRRPRLAAFGTGCAYLTREALEAHQPLDPSREPGDALEDLAGRIRHPGCCTSPPTTF